MLVRLCRGLAGGGVALAIACAGQVQAQPGSNSLVPGITPYAPKATASAPQGAKGKDGADASSDVASGTSSPGSDSAKIGNQAQRQTPASQVASDSAPAPAAASLNPKASYDYVLGPGDKLRIQVFGEELLSGEFNVAGNGQISFPLIGQLQAAGITVRHLQTELRAALADGYLKDPRVSAEVLTFRPYYILGEVAKPGEYPYTDGISVLNAIATAGGFSYRANHRVIFIKRPNELAEHRERLTPDLLLAPGDTVRIVERYF